jgi:hypothetical protein
MGAIRIEEFCDDDRGCPIGSLGTRVVTSRLVTTLFGT